MMRLDSQAHGKPLSTNTSFQFFPRATGEETRVLRCQQRGHTRRLRHAAFQFRPPGCQSTFYCILIHICQVFEASLVLYTD